LVKASFAVAPSAEASFANAEDKVSAFAFWLTRHDGLGLSAKGHFMLPGVLRPLWR
jgi:hypothetical protein